jgi:hypothetical protein
VLYTFLCSLLQSFIFIVSAFTYSYSTLIVIGHYLRVTTTILFLFSLCYLNDIFSYQSSFSCTRAGTLSLLYKIKYLKQSQKMPIFYQSIKKVVLPTLPYFTFSKSSKDKVPPLLIYEKRDFISIKLSYFAKNK